jgi:hypothetical protein
VTYLAQGVVMTPSQEDAREELRRAVGRRVCGVMAGYTVEVRAEDIREVLHLIDDLEEQLAAFEDG